MSYKSFGLIFAAGVLVGANPTVPLAQQSPSVTRTELQRIELKDSPGKEAIMFMADFPPGGVAPRHFHSGDEFIYMVEGTLIVEPDSKPPMTLKKGETAFHGAGLVHSGRNASATEPAKVLLFIVSADKGKPLATPAPPTQ